MATYLVHFSGKNFLMDSPEGPIRKKFRAVRLVEAESEKSAEDLSRQWIVNDPRIQKSMLNEEGDPPEMHIERIRKVPAMAYDAQNRANALYRENEGDG